jgi:acetyl esterase/lipase
MRKMDGPPLADAHNFLYAVAMKFRRLFPAALLLAASIANAQTPPPAIPLPHGEIANLWPTAAPGAVGTEPQDIPHLEIFPATGPGPHTAVIVAPGGGYTSLAYGKEGSFIAVWLNKQGISAFVLSYRLSPRYHYPSPLLDGERSIRWVRANAAKFNVDPTKIGFWGFSAGGHLTGYVGTHFDAGNPSAPDPIDRISSRPDFCISSYGGLTLDPAIAKPTAMRTLTGPNPPQSVLDEISPDKHVTPQTPPFFLYATTIDEKVPVLSSVVFYTALVRAGVPAEMHIFQSGPHGTALGEKYPALSIWPTILANWMRLNHWLPPLTP